MEFVIIMYLLNLALKESNDTQIQPKANDRIFKGQNQG